MTPADRAAVGLAKQSGAWGLLADAQDGILPDDLRDGLATDEVATATT